MTKRTLVPLKQSAATRRSRPDKSWAVYFPATGQDGLPVRLRRFFRHKADAEAFSTVKRAEIASLGLKAGALSDDLKEQALVCSGLLAPIGKTLLEAVRGFIENHKASQHSVAVRVAAEALRQQASANGLSHRHRLAISNMLARFCRNHGDQLVANITSEHVQAWLDGHTTKDGNPLSPISFNSYRRYLGLFLSFCVRKGWAAENAASGVALKKVKTKVPRLLTPKELETILSESPPEMRLMVCILAQCGLRVSEAARLRWEDILLRGDEGYIQLGADTTKTARRRLTPIPPALMPAFEANKGRQGYLFEAGKGSVNALQLALTKLRSTVKGTSWGRNAFRASALSYRLALTKDAAATALEMGNSPMVLMRDYRELATHSQAAEWFAICSTHPTKVNLA